MPGRLGYSLEIKSVDLDQRIVEGYAAVTGNRDHVRDVLDAKALRRATEKPPQQVAVFIGHDASQLPVGIPIEIRADGTGLFTKTKVFKTTAGDDLLQVARELQEHGQTLGMSIGYKTIDARFEKGDDNKTVRRLLDIDLIEYSFAAPQTIVNPRALVTAVKAMTEGSDTGGGYLTDDAEDHLQAVHDAHCNDRACSHRRTKADATDSADSDSDTKTLSPDEARAAVLAFAREHDADLASTIERVLAEQKTATTDSTDQPEPDDYAARVALLGIDVNLALARA